MSNWDGFRVVLMVLGTMATLTGVTMVIFGVEHGAMVTLSGLVAATVSVVLLEFL